MEQPKKPKRGFENTILRGPVGTGIYQMKIIESLWCVAMIQIERITCLSVDMDNFDANLKEVNDLIDADISHRKYVIGLGKCRFCKTKAVDEMEFETGNGANCQVSIPMCEVHLKELEDTGYNFEEKYAEQICDEYFENLRGQADAMRE